MPTDKTLRIPPKSRPSDPQPRAGKEPLHRALLVACLIYLALTFPAQSQLAPQPATVRIGVLSLFRPRTLTLTADHPLTVLLDGTPRILDPRHPATLLATPTGLTVDSTPTHTLTTAPTTFTLTVPNKLTRPYCGALTVSARDGILIPVITMDTELAVASIVAAESPPQAPLEALKVQAITSRSFLLANPRTHLDFDACDTTHCQFLRSPPPANSSAAIATRATRHVVLTWRPSPAAQHRIVAAMYARSCGGHTRVPPNPSPGAYPFYSVACSFCLRHPETWSRPATTPAPLTEQQRLAFNRTHGWSAIPSNATSASATALEGRGTGHGIGLCQLGAADLARRGQPAAQILAHYFPNTSLTLLP